MNTVSIADLLKDGVLPEAGAKSRKPLRQRPGHVESLGLYMDGASALPSVSLNASSGQNTEEQVWQTTSSSTPASNRRSAYGGYVARHANHIEN